MDENAIVSMTEYSVFYADGTSIVLAAPTIEIAAEKSVKTDVETLKIIKNKEIKVYVDQDMLTPVPDSTPDAAAGD